MRPRLTDALLQQNAWMKQLCIANLLSSLEAGRNERRRWREDRHIRVAEKIFAGAQFETLESGGVGSERDCDDLLEAVKTNVVVPQEPHVVGENFLHAAGANRNERAGMVVNVGFSNRERMLGDGSRHVLIVCCSDVVWSSRELKMEFEL